MDEHTLWAMVALFCSTVTFCGLVRWTKDRASRKKLLKIKVQGMKINAKEKAREEKRRDDLEKTGQS